MRLYRHTRTSPLNVDERTTCDRSLRKASFRTRARCCRSSSDARGTAARGYLEGLTRRGPSLTSYEENHACLRILYENETPALLPVPPSTPVLLGRSRMAIERTLNGHAVLRWPSRWMR